MKIVERENGGIEILSREDKITLGRSTFDGETVCSVNGKGFYLFIWQKKRIVAPIKHANPAWLIGNYNANQVRLDLSKEVREPDEIKFFDRITEPLSALEGLIKRSMGVIPDTETWRTRMRNIFQEESAISELKKLLFF